VISVAATGAHGVGGGAAEDGLGGGGRSTAGGGGGARALPHRAAPGTEPSRAPNPTRFLGPVIALLANGSCKARGPRVGVGKGDGCLAVLGILGEVLVSCRGVEGSS
jgi:hypothetical protein